MNEDEQQAAPSASDLDAAAAETQAAVATGPGDGDPPPPPAQNAEQEAQEFVAKFGGHLSDARAALEHLKTSSNAEHQGTIVHTAIRGFDKSLHGLGELYEQVKKHLG